MSLTNTPASSGWTIPCTKWTIPPTKKPAGSGWFSLVIGGVFFLLAVLILIFRWDVSKINANHVLTAWMIFSGIVMGVWGIVRIKTTTKPGNPQVGQNTLNFCVAIIGATFAILALVIAK
jgi:hypothetical protein